MQSMHCIGLDVHKKSGSNRNTAERTTHAAKNQKRITPALLRSASENSCPVDKDLS
jgi:hypothetical protein